MTCPKDLSAADLSPFAGQSLSLRTGDGTGYAVELTEVRLLGGRYPGSARDPFALTFRGASGLRLPQGIYRFEIPGADPLEFFITQTADNAGGSWFEAVFT